jgi:hypothetical protein
MVKGHNRIFLLIAVVVIFLVYIVAPSGGLLDRLASSTPHQGEGSSASQQIGLDSPAPALLPSPTPEYGQSMTSANESLPKPESTQAGSE